MIRLAIIGGAILFAGTSAAKPAEELAPSLRQKLCAGPVVGLSAEDSKRAASGSPLLFVQRSIAKNRGILLFTNCTSEALVRVTGEFKHKPAAYLRPWPILLSRTAKSPFAGDRERYQLLDFTPEDAKGKGSVDVIGGMTINYDQARYADWRYDCEFIVTVTTKQGERRNTYVREVNVCDSVALTLRVPDVRL